MLSARSYAPTQAEPRSALRGFNRASDHFTRPTVEIARRRVSAFRVCGYTGLTAALALSTLLILHRGLSPWVMAAN